MSFANLRQRKTSNLASIQKQINENKGGFKKDERFWKVSTDASGNGTATVRFMPAPNDEGAPFSKIYKYSFLSKGKWYIENSPNTLGLPDPVAEYNKELWDQAVAEVGPKADHPLKDDVRGRKRKERYITNILVVADSKNPDNVGKTFLYDMPKTLFDKLTEAVNPAFEGEESVNIFDFWTGADFQVKAYRKTGTKFLNFDKSAFKTPGPVKLNKKVLSDEELEVIYNGLYSLSAEIASDKFKSYPDLVKRFNDVMGIKAVVAPKVEEDLSAATIDDDELPFPVNEVTKVDEAMKNAEDDDSSFFEDM